MRFLLLIALFTTHILLVRGQGPISGFMVGRAKTDLALNYGFDSFDTYLFGNERQNISTTTEWLSLYVEHGLTDTLSIVFTAPYVRIENGEQGLQDASLYLKYQNQKIQFEKGTLRFVSAAGISLPLSGYTLDALRPIGERATVLHGRFLAQYSFHFGLFFQLQSGVDFRVSPQSQGAIPLLLRSGFGTNRFYLETWVEFRRTLNAGVDDQIRGGSGSNWIKVGGSLYLPLTPFLGLNAGGSYFLSGRNVGLSTLVFGGIILKRNWKK